MGHSGRIIAEAADAAADAVEVRLVDSESMVSALVAAALEVNGWAGFRSELRITLPLTGTAVRVRTVCEVLPDIHVEEEREVDIARLMPRGER
jgi:hypothetical protein